MKKREFLALSAAGIGTPILGMASPSVFGQSTPSPLFDKDERTIEFEERIKEKINHYKLEAAYDVFQEDKTFLNNLKDLLEKESNTTILSRDTESNYAWKLYYCNHVDLKWLENIIENNKTSYYVTSCVKRGSSIKWAEKVVESETRKDAVGSVVCELTSMGSSVEWAKKQIERSECCHSAFYLTKKYNLNPKWCEKIAEYKKSGDTAFRLVNELGSDISWAERVIESGDIVKYNAYRMTFYGYSTPEWYEKVVGEKWA